MKNRICILIVFICMNIGAHAQTPQLINYQAVARDNTGAPLPNQSVGLRLSILDVSSTGTVLYQETQTATTNQFGLFTLQIGGGTIVSGTFSGINWGTNSKYVKVEMDPTGGTNYTVTGASQLVSVPYALMSANNWSITGNAGTNASIDFIGTTDARPLVFKVDGIQAGRIDYLNTSANTSLGFNTLPNSTGSGNTAFGYNALEANTTGYDNVAINIALEANTTGNNNIGIGSTALPANTTGNQNIAVGGQAMEVNTTGNQNIAVGDLAGYNNNTGSNNTALGYNSGVSTGALSNTTALGNGASVSASNKMAIGNTSITSIQGQVAFTTFSDARVKNNVQANVPGLAFITALRPVTYHYDIKKENELLGIKNDTANWNGKYDIEKMTFSGFIAQEVDATAKRIGYDFSGVDKSGALLGIRYSDFVPSIVKAVQEQQEVIAKQQGVITNLQEQIKAMTQMQTELTTRLGQVEAALAKQQTQGKMTKN